MRKIYSIYGTNSHDMTKKLLEASEAISLVPSGADVALKPNLVVAGTPDNGATTHAGVLSGCIEYFRDAGIKDISIIEGSWVRAETMRVSLHCPHKNCYLGGIRQGCVVFMSFGL